MWNLMFTKNSSPNWAAETHFIELLCWGHSSKLLSSEGAFHMCHRHSLMGLKTWTWTKGHVTPRIPTGPLQCGFSDDRQDVTSGWSPYNIHHICKVSLQCAPSDVCGNVRPGWSPYHTVDTYRVSLLCGPSDERWGQHSNWILSHTAHT